MQPSSDVLNHYQSTNIESGSPAQLVVLLYHGALRFAAEALSAQETGKLEERSERLNRATRIVQELANALDHEVGGEWAANIAALYEFVLHEWAEATMASDGGRIENGIRILEILLPSWESIARGEHDSSGDLPARGTAQPTIPGSLSISC